MSQPIQIADDIVALSTPHPSAVSNLSADFSRVIAPLKMLASLLVAPLLLVVAILGFVFVLADFALFRLRDLRAGHPDPKALWEF